MRVISSFTPFTSCVIGAYFWTVDSIPGPITASLYRPHAGPEQIPHFNESRHPGEEPPMPEENPTLARGSALDQATFDDFVTRLRHHCRGRGVSDHCTADAIFLVERRELIYGLDTDFRSEEHTS